MKTILQQAQILFSMKRYSEAVAIVQPLISTHPQRADLPKFIGGCYRADGKNLLAIEYFLLSLKIDTGQHELYNIIGNIYKSSSNFELAENYYMKAIYLDDSNVSYLNNISFLYIKMKDYEKAEKYFHKALQIENSNVNTKIGLSNVLNLRNNKSKAKLLLKEIIQQNPNNFVAVYNLALIYKDQKIFDKAVYYFKCAKDIQPNNVKLIENLGFLYFENGEYACAIEVFKKGLQLNPYDTVLNGALANLLWEQKESGHLAHYESLEIGSMPLSLSLDYFYKLIKSGLVKKACDVIAIIESSNKIDTALIIARSQLYYELKNFDEGFAVLSKISLERDLKPEELDWLGRHALALGDYSSALCAYEKLVSTFPDNKGYWCLLSSALREIDKERYLNLCRYNDLIFMVDIPPPRNYANIEDFNRELKLELCRQHVSKQQPLAQSLEGGTQTIGNLFTGAKGCVGELRKSLESSIYNALSELNVNEEHPILKYAKNDVKFSGAWSVWLNSSGYHKNHFHSEGWYSGVYYVDIPNSEALDANAGSLKIGEPDVYIPSQPSAEIFIEPKAGRLVLFPSFLWHGTVPFTSKNPRVTVAFDIVPQT